jgi:hypothetical protein
MLDYLPPFVSLSSSCDLSLPAPPDAINRFSTSAYVEHRWCEVRVVRFYSGLGFGLVVSGSFDPSGLESFLARVNNSFMPFDGLNHTEPTRIRVIAWFRTFRVSCLFQIHIQRSANVGSYLLLFRTLPRAMHR